MGFVADWVLSLKPDAVDNPFGRSLRKVAGDNCGCTKGCPDYRSHNNLAIKQYRHRFPKVVPSSCADFLSPGRIELDAYAVLRRATAQNGSGRSDIAIANDDLIVKVN